MLRKRFVVVVLAAAAAACSDTPSMPENTVAPLPETPVLHAYRGTLVAGSLLRSDGRLISLAGWQTHLFGQLLGAEIMVEGHVADEDPENGLMIHDFLVLSLDDMPVVDGTLWAREEGYYIRGREGTFELPQVPETLAHYLGRRVFVAHTGGAIMRYGLLELEE
jgi:hypothetical protein